MDKDLQAYLEQCDVDYDVEVAMVGAAVHGPGYHSCLPSGIRAHGTRDALQYALALLQAGGADRAARAAAIVDRLLSLQDRDPFSPTYGIWSWFLEEPLDRMSPPDWNWADFCGALLAQMLVHHAGQLTEARRAAMRAALGHAAWSIFRRNVNLDYTNIAIMGGGVTAAAGELLGEPRLLDFGRERLRRVIEVARHHGAFPEYNSPTYTRVALEECERTLHLVRDSGAREAAEQLRQIGWRVFAEHFHPGTGQLTGPQARAYTDRLSRELAGYLSRQTGAAIACHPAVMAAAGPVNPSLVPERPCPQEWRARFERLPEAPVEWRTPLVRLVSAGGALAGHAGVSRFSGRGGRYAYADRAGCLWCAEDACLGTVSHDDLWVQRRPLLGYWRTDADPAVVLRLRFLYDGRDFASAYLRNCQAGPRVLSAVTLLTDRGAHHPYFDHPKDDLFRVSDLRLRYELAGAGVRVETLAGGNFALAAGRRRAIVHTAPGCLGAQAVRWEAGQAEGRAYVDAVCHSGGPAGFNLAEMTPVLLASALELAGPEQTGPAAGSVEVTAGAAPGSYSVRWSGLNLDLPGPSDTYPV